MLGIAEGILQDLHNDHSEVDSLMDRIMDSKDSGERAALFDEMKTKLLAHAHADQEVLYRALEAGRSDGSRSFAREGANEHQIVEGKLHKLSADGDQAGEQWMAELKVLRATLNDTVSSEWMEDVRWRSCAILRAGLSAHQSQDRGGVRC